MPRVGCSSANFRPRFVTKLQHGDHEKLKTPSGFMKHIEDENKSRSVASVLSPLKKLCHIKLIKKNSEIFFKEGWPEFFKFHNLEAGFTLMFQYEGNMVFSVKVFGLNGCLKNCKLGAVDLNGSRKKSAEKCASKKAVPSCSGKQTERKHDMLMGETPRENDRSNIRDELQTPSNSHVKKKNTSLQTHVTIMSHSKIYNYMNFPKKFGSVRPYILEKGEVTVKNENQDTWKVLFNTCRGYNYLIGWKEFCFVNGIEVGDLCKFEIIAQNEILVIISKAARTADVIDVK
ncbi:transcriptional factor B3 family protein [Rhynchospora pubera]|uniref:Transcriptional factor B3 family protein n=1 Tax=Rhynchospora pubera TaxID=906938 RepID=A0AAV8H4A8_9POAL|nr:transcriptional factor B3 family protein [Rhynchospora pubera]